MNKNIGLMMLHIVASALVAAAAIDVVQMIENHGVVALICLAVVLLVFVHQVLMFKNALTRYREDKLRMCSQKNAKK